MIFSVLGSLLNVCLLLFAAFLLGSAELSNYGVVLAKFELFFAFFSLGFNQYLLIHPNHTAKYSVKLAIIWQSIVVSIVTSIFFKFFLSEISLWIMLVILSTKVLDFWSNYLGIFLEIDKKFKRIQLFRFISRVLSFVVVIILLLKFHTWKVIILNSFFMNAGIVCFLIFYNYRPTLNIQGNGDESIRKTFSFGFQMLGLNLGERVFKRLDIILADMLFTPEIVGAYFVFKNLIDGVLGLCIKPIQTVLLSFFRNTNGIMPILKMRLALMKAHYLRYLGFILIVAVSLLVFDEVLVYLLPPTYYDNRAVGYLLTAVGFLSAIFEVLKVYGLANEKQRIFILARGVQIVSFPIVVFIIASASGLLALPISLLFSTVLSLIIIIYNVWNTVHNKLS